MGEALGRAALPVASQLPCRLPKTLLPPHPRGPCTLEAPGTVGAHGLVLGPRPHARPPPAREPRPLFHQGTLPKGSRDLFQGPSLTAQGEALGP